MVQQILDGVDDIEFCQLTARDVVRHRLVGKIVAAYDQFDTAEDEARPPRQDRRRR